MRLISLKSFLQNRVDGLWPTTDSAPSAALSITTGTSLTQFQNILCCEKLWIATVVLATVWFEDYNRRQFVTDVPQLRKAGEAQMHVFHLRHQFFAFSSSL